MLNNITTAMQSYWELCKPKVVALMLLTTLVGMHLASNQAIPATIIIYTLLGIGLCAGSAATINHIVDQQVDKKMLRTLRRPLPTGRISSLHAMLFALIIGGIGMLILTLRINLLTAELTFLTLIGYAVFYTLFLKRMTPQNIVIGGAAGAAPPLLGWTAITNHIDANGLLLVLIIFTWTPPHFWALAIHRYQDYLQAKIPMLPVTHGIRFTKLNILLYTLLMFICSLLPFVTGMSGWFYLCGATILGSRFIYLAIQLKIHENGQYAIKTFNYSIFYLMGLFIIILIDHYL